MHVMAATTRPISPFPRSLHDVEMVFLAFLADEGAATAVEFAMISVPFLAMLMAIFEVAFVFFATEGVQAAVMDASRAILTGQVQSLSGISTATQFRDQIICSPTTPRVRVLPGFVDCSKIIVDVRTAASFGSANLAKDFASNPSTMYCTGGPNQIVIVRAIYPMPVYLSILSKSGSSITTNTSGLTTYQGSNKHMILGTSAFRNEPFIGWTGAATGC